MQLTTCDSCSKVILKTTNTSNSSPTYYTLTKTLGYSPYTHTTFHTNEDLVKHFCSEKCINAHFNPNEPYRKVGHENNLPDIKNIPCPVHVNGKKESEYFCICK